MELDSGTIPERVDSNTQSLKKVRKNKMENKIKSYKGFHKDMTCRDFQYKEEGSTRKNELMYAIRASMPASIR